MSLALAVKEAIACSSARSYQPAKIQINAAYWQRTQRLAERLRAMGIDPEEL